ncbi:response regulator transcription factor [Acetobacter okinawensis]|uniref:response regulator transcription factor n=1 Tax=Acetobacter okinawensis TaxID=1076594 RepID=UPI00046E9927|nr:response regulator transcription factor [Acetobacter okinawensis]MBS0964991.1 response regulator transcription factor [Acetobacter okinawensis]MBS0989389.1 response regulator transcription factor [Acetobacter okinawensis]MCP1212353.1 response regulator transcription factor [Acetobacter okinawensis]
MRLLCIGDSSTPGGLRPCHGLAEAAVEGALSITMSGPEGVVETLRRSQYDIVVIQLAQPDTRLLRHIRNSRIPTPVIMIVRASTPVEVAEALSIGADDCVSATIEPVELLARLRAIVRRTGGHDSLSLHIGRMVVNVDRRQVHIDKRPLPLTPREYDVVELLTLRKNQVLSKEALLDNLYAGQEEPHGKIIDVMVCKIRKKMRAFGITDPFITQWGIGYRLNEQAFIPLGARMSAHNASATPASRETSLPVTRGINVISPTNKMDVL